MPIKLLGNEDSIDGSLGTSDRFDLFRYQCTTSGWATQFRIEKGSASGNVKVNVYADYSGDPGSLIWSNDNDNVVDDSTEIITIDAPFKVTAGEYYWLGFDQETANTCSYSSSVSGYRYYKSATYSTFEAPDPAGTGFTDTYVILARMSLYGETSKGTTYRDIMENGGGDLAYLWHVAGYPWAVTDNPELITALSNTSDTTVQAARKRLFGTNTFTLSTTITPAYSVPIFPGLIRDFGKSKWSMDESRGLLKGGEWKVKIEDRDHGHTWDHAVSGDEIWGLEGLHRIARLRDSSVHGWGYLDDNFTITVAGGSAGQLFIKEETGSRLYNRIDGCSGDEWIPIWINHECVATASIDGTVPSYEIEIQGGGAVGGGRGLYRSRPQDHFTAVLKSLDPIVADVPGGVAGKYCWLYAIPLHEGAVMTRSDDEPIIAEIESGVITPNIRTRDSVTEVSIRGSLSSLEKTVNIERSKATETGLTGFVFSRGSSGTTIDDIEENVQMPHFVIREYTANWQDLSDAIAEVVAGTGTQEQVEMLLTADNWSERYIWICGKNQVVTFDTPEDVMVALNDELNRCYEDIDEKHSENTTLTRPYSIVLSGTRPNECYRFRYTGSQGALRDTLRETQFSGESAHPDVVLASFTGPLAWLFCLGNPMIFGNDNMYRQLQRDHAYYRYLETVIYNHTIPWSSLSRTYGRWMSEDMFSGADLSNPIGDVLDAPSDRSSIFIPKYYYGWDHKNHPLTRDLDTGNPQITTNWHIPTSQEDGSDRLFLASGTDLDSFADGDEITIGDGRRFPKLHATVDALQDCDFTDMESFEMEDSYLNVESGETIYQGTSLFYLPCLEYNGRDQDDIDDIKELDAHYVHKALNLKSVELSDVLKKILGESVTGLGLAKEVQQTQNPFFTTTGDFISQLDFDSLDDVADVSGIIYNLDFDNADSIAKILKDEILFHAAHMTREWDDDDQMWKFRFRAIGQPNKSDAWSMGYRLTEAKTQTGAPVETHGDSDLYNALNFKIAAPAADYDRTYEQKNASIVGTDERRTLKIKPVISKINGFSFFSNDMHRHFINLLNAISTPQVVQTKKITTMQQLFPIGREILVTDTTAREPYTHARVLTTEPALVVGMSFDIAKQKGELSYRIGVQGDALSYGYAPSCYITTGNFSKIVGEWSGTPIAHKFTSTRQANDVYYFDCFDLYDPSNPKARDCSCSDYKVWVHEEGTYNWTPLEFTCSVSASTGVITLTGDTTNIDTSKNYFVTFREWADLEDCQKMWCTHADDNNTIGSSSLPAHRWV